MAWTSSNSDQFGVPALCLHSVASLQREKWGVVLRPCIPLVWCKRDRVHFVMLFRLFSPLITVSLYSMMSMLQTLTRDHDHAWSNTANYMQWARFLRALGLLGKAPTHNTIETGSAPLLYNYYPARSTSILIRKTTSANLLRSNLARICRSGSGEDAPLKPVFLTIWIYTSMLSRYQKHMGSFGASVKSSLSFQPKVDVFSTKCI